MTQRLAARGHDVVVVNRNSGPEQTFGPVAWTSYERISAADIGIVWRRPALLDLITPGAARRLYLWLHDWLPQVRVLERLDAFAKVMVLSRFHRGRIAAVPDDRVFITANGIDPSQLATGAGARDPNLMVYGSCYTRGLRTLLENWPRIRAAAPAARLHIFYGWDVLRERRPAHFARIHPHFERLMQQEGITHLGKVSHAEVARQYACAGVWAYPCAFPEVSCISAMKAQAGGAVPAVIASGALAETVRHGFSTMRSHTDYDPLPLPRRVIDEWLEGLTALLRSPERQEQIRGEMIADSAHRFDWAKVTSAWEMEFAGA